MHGVTGHRSIQWVRKGEDEGEGKESALARRQRQETEKAIADLNKKHALERHVAQSFYNRSGNNPDAGIYMPAGVYEEQVQKNDVMAYIKQRGIKKYAKEYGIPLVSIVITFVAVPVIAGAIPLLGAAHKAWKIWEFYKVIFDFLFDPTTTLIPKVDTDIGGFVYDMDGKLVVQETSRKATSITFLVIGGIVFIGYAATKTVEVFRKYQNTQSITKILFEDYYDWQHLKIKEIKGKYEIPDKHKRDDIISQYVCQISGQPTVFPVRDKTHNHLFEHANIMSHLTQHSRCPVTGHALDAAELAFDHITYNVIRGRIDELPE